MDSRELRQGNYVLQTNNVDYDDHDNDFLPDNILTVGKHLFTYDHKDIKPIPLTEEWLLNLGFELNKNKNYINYIIIVEDYYHSVEWDKQETKFRYSDDKSNAWCYTIRHIEYLHQLQNLYFALTNKELTKTNKL